MDLMHIKSSSLPPSKVRLRIVYDVERVEATLYESLHQGLQGSESRATTLRTGRPQQVG